MKYSGAETPLPPRSSLVPVRAGDQEVEHEREAEREEQKRRLRNVRSTS